MNQNKMKVVCCSRNGSLLNHQRSGLFLKDIRRSALLALVFGVAVVLTTGCSATGEGVKAELIAPVASYGSTIEDDGFYQPPRSPGFNDVTGS
jgi:hypothetical protein